jgi:DNA gyrase subunit A
MLIIPDFEQAKFITLLTRQARIKRMDLNALSNVRSSGIIAINLDGNDSLEWAQLTHGNEEFMIVTKLGKALRFQEGEVRAMGRAAAGVMAMRLLGGDEIVSLDVAKPDGELFVIHERGWGKRVSLDEYNAKGRYTQGMYTTAHDRLDEIGPIVTARVVHPDDHVTMMTSNGIVLRTKVRGISRFGRMTRGVRIVNLQDGDTVAAVAVIKQEDMARGVDGGIADETLLPETTEPDLLTTAAVAADETEAEPVA